MVIVGICGTLSSIKMLVGRPAFVRLGGSLVLLLLLFEIALFFTDFEFVREQPFEGIVFVVVRQLKCLCYPIFLESVRISVMSPRILAIS